MLREGSPFMEFLAIVSLLVGSGVALVALAIFASHGASADQIPAFFIHAAETLLGAVIALAYAARGVFAAKPADTLASPPALDTPAASPAPLAPEAPAGEVRQ